MAVEATDTFRIAEWAVRRRESRVGLLWRFTLPQKNEGPAGPRPAPRPPGPPTPGRSGRRGCEPDADLAALEPLLDQRAARVQRLELAESDLVGVLQALLAERPLRAFGRAAENGRLARALAGEVGQRLHAVLVGERGGHRERV